MLFGHLAVSALEHRYTQAEFAPIMVAAIFPDAVDKMVHYVLGGLESGRTLGHSLTGALTTTVVVALIWGKFSAESWVLGYLSHLICDMGHVVPWLYPFVTYEFPESEEFLSNLWYSLTNAPQMALEITLTIWAVIALWPAIMRLKSQLFH